MHTFAPLRLQNFRGKNESVTRNFGDFEKLFIQNFVFSFKARFIFEMLMTFCRNFTNMFTNLKIRYDFRKKMVNFAKFLRNFRNR